MEKGYYILGVRGTVWRYYVAIHNKNGKGLLQERLDLIDDLELVAIHNKNGKGLLRKLL